MRKDIQATTREKLGIVATGRAFRMEDVTYAELKDVLGGSKKPSPDGKVRYYRIVQKVERGQIRWLAVWDYYEKQALKYVRVWSCDGSQSLAKELFPHATITD